MKGGTRLVISGWIAGDEEDEAGRVIFASNRLGVTMTGNGIWAGLFAIGVLTGLRTMTPIAVLCWMTALGRVAVAPGWMGFVRNWISVGVFSAGAVGELIGDKLPVTPSRLKAPGLIGRVVFGGLCGAILGAAYGVSGIAGALVGAAGGLAGCFGGWFVRTRAVAGLRCPDWPVALVEDAIAVAGSVTVCWLMGR